MFMSLDFSVFFSFCHLKTYDVKIFKVSFQHFCQTNFHIENFQTHTWCLMLSGNCQKWKIQMIHMKRICS